MRALVAISVLACCGPAVPPPALAQPGVPRLPPPPLIDPSRPGAAYLTSVAVQLQPGWGQFLDDCRLRLPASHALNAMALSATAQLVIDRRGKLVETNISRSSGNADFDRAVRDAMADATAFNPPPLELVSDDDRVHLRWLFARDRRQAGPATAELERVELPIAGVTARLVAEGDLARAARRVAAAPASDDRIAASERVMIAALREALHANDSAARRAAIGAIARAKVIDLARDVRALLVDTTDTEVLIGAIVAAGELGDRDAADALMRGLERDFAAVSSQRVASSRPRIAQAELRAAIALGLRDRAAVVLHSALAGAQQPSPLAIEALALAPSADLDGQLGGWLVHGDAHVRGAVCAALAGLAPARAERLVMRGLGDADASVRARCVETAGELGHREVKLAHSFASVAFTLAHDRDRDVRAAALLAGARITATVPDASNDTAADVRAAYARALVMALTRADSIAHRPNAAGLAEISTKLRALVDDREIEVRAAAWEGLATLASAAGTGAPAIDPSLVARAVADPASEVRGAAVASLADEALLERLAAGDDAPDVRTAAQVRLAQLRGRAAITERLLDRLAAASPASADRARVALAWLLAK